QFLVHVVVTMSLDERQVVIVAVSAMTKADPRHEFVRLGNLLDRFEIAPAIDEREHLPRAVRTLDRDSHIRCCPSMAPFGANAPARRNAVLKHLHRDFSMAGVDAAKVFAMVVAAVMGVTVIVAAFMGV